MLYVRRAEDRFHTDAGWLDSHHTFSFGEHYDPRFDGFRRLRVINDDTVAAGGGFPTHGHRDMDIISYVIEGALGHKDSMGNGSVIKPGDVQRMTAGAGVSHSEHNASDGPTHFLQIWLVPDQRGGKPSYEQKLFTPEQKRNKLALIASGKKQGNGAVALHEDADLYATVLTQGAHVDHALAAGRYAWIHVVTGQVRVNDQPLRTGDGAGLAEVSSIKIEAVDDDSEVLLFDLA